MKIDRSQLELAVSAPESALVFPFGSQTRAGFGSTYSGFLHYLMLCLRQGVGFRLTKIQRPQGFIERLGWRDYFLPFCQETSGPLLEELNRHHFPADGKFPILRPLARAWLRRFTKPRAQYFAFDESLPIPICGPSFFDDPEDFYACRKALMSALWLYNDQTLDDVSTFKDLLPEAKTMVSMCIRRGDKTIEHPYVRLEKYAIALDQAGIQSGEIFVATDDHSCIGELETVLTQFTIHTLSQPQDSGYIHADFKKLPAIERRRRTTRFFAQYEMLRDSSLCITTQTTNVSWMVNAARGGNGMIWVDGDTSG
jgi:hypothetical protein